jgi:hypothetical protein
LGGVHATKPDPLTSALADRLQKLWDAYVLADEEGHSAFLADNYRAVFIAMEP